MQIIGLDEHATCLLGFYVVLIYFECFSFSECRRVDWFDLFVKLFYFYSRMPENIFGLCMRNIYIIWICIPIVSFCDVGAGGGKKGKIN